MRKPHRPHRPGDLFIDRYMPGATAEEREAAHRRLRRLIRILMRIDARLAADAVKAPIRANAEGAVESDSNPA